MFKGEIAKRKRNTLQILISLDNFSIICDYRTVEVVVSFFFVVWTALDLELVGGFLDFD